jgi:Family of unknown function (DUF6152)
MKNKLFALMIAGGSCLVGSRAYAHHSFSATYKDDEKVTVHGKLVQFLFRNPHSFVQVQAPDDKGQMVVWAVEWAAAGQLGKQGVTKDSLKVGDDVIVVGTAGRDPADHRIRMMNITRTADGSKFGGAFD